MRQREIESLLKPFEGDNPSISLLVMRDGVPVIRESRGYANLEVGELATPETNYRLASVTKQFTAAAILLLARDGTLDLDDSVSKWLPALPPATSAIRIRHLLSHTSGLVDYEDLIPESETAQMHDAGVLKLLERENRTMFDPGLGYHYSNSGYALLALIVERASGESFSEFLSSRIFGPLGMMETVAHQEGKTTISSRAFGYSREGHGWSRDDQSITSAVLGDGGIYSSIDDLAKWNAALDSSSLLGFEMQTLAFSPVTDTDRPGVRYAMGWRIEGASQWHTGSTRGFRNVILRIPSERLSIVVLTNRNEGEPLGIALEIAGILRAHSDSR